AALPVPGKVLGAALDRAAVVDLARTADPHERRELEPLLPGAAHERLQHLDEALHRLVALGVLVAVTPEIGLPDRRARQVRRLLGVQLHDPGANVRPADVDREDAVVPGEDPRRREVHGADQAGLVGMVPDRADVDVDAVAFQDDARATDRELADPAEAKPASHGDALRVAPRLEPHEAADDTRELLSEILDRPVHDAGRLRLALREDRLEGLLSDLLARHVAEGIGVELAQRLAPLLQDRAERALARAVADEPVLVLDLEVVAVDVDRRQVLGAVRPERRLGPRHVRHPSWFGARIPSASGDGSLSLPPYTGRPDSPCRRGPVAARGRARR